MGSWGFRTFRSRLHVVRDVFDGKGEVPAEKREKCDVEEREGEEKEIDDDEDDDDSDNAEGDQYSMFSPD